MWFNINRNVRHEWIEDIIQGNLMLMATMTVSGRGTQMVYFLSFTPSGALTRFSFRADLAIIAMNRLCFDRSSKRGYM